MSDRPDPIEAWGEVSAAAASATGYRRVGPAAAVARPVRRWHGVGSLGLMTVALIVIVGALTLRPASRLGASPPVTGEADDGMFRLELTTPHDTYGPGDAIEPVARVTYLGPDGAITVQHGNSQLVFQIHEVDGSRAMDGGDRLSCGSTNLVKSEPLVVPFGKSGSPDDPTKGFDLTWYKDPVLTLPTGTWRITANLAFGVGGCETTHRLSVSNVLHVVAPTGDGPVVDVADDGVFRLELATPRRTYAPTEAIEPVAIVTYLGPADQIAMYHGGQIVGWEIAEVGGNRAMNGGMTAPCVPDVMRKDTPLTFPFAKSGAIDRTFDAAWFADPVLHLPVGTWRIKAYTTISTDENPLPSDGSFTCGTKGHSQGASIVIIVNGDAAPSESQSASPSPTVEPSPTATQTAVPSPSAGPVIGSVGDGVFRLDLRTPHGIYAPNDVIEPVATLFYVGPESDVMFGHGAPTISFRIEEVGGTRIMDGGVADVCLSTALVRGQPALFDFIKGGTIGDTFDQAWFDNPELRLPVGTWRILAYLDAYVDQCGLDADIHQLTVENVIEVVDDSAMSPSPSAEPPTGTTSPAPSMLPDATVALEFVRKFEDGLSTGHAADTWSFLSPWSQQAVGSIVQFEADYTRVPDAAALEIGPPSQDPELLSRFFLGPRADDLAKSADPARTFLVPVRDPSVDGAAAATTNLVVAPLNDGSWRIWLDRAGG